MAFSTGRMRAFEGTISDVALGWNSVIDVVGALGKDMYYLAEGVVMV
jgi:hypothetical protein